MSKKDHITNSAPLGFVLFMAYCGAAAYFIHQTSGFFGVIWALIKAIVWPAILVYHAFTAFNV